MRSRLGPSESDDTKGFNSKSKAVSSPTKIPVHNQAVSYVVDFGVGASAGSFSLIVDTGSSNTWVGAGSTKYVKGKNGKATGDQATVTYGSGSFSGKEYVDRVIITAGSKGGSLVIDQQSIGVADAGNSVGFDGVDGILGIGPTSLTLSTLSPNKSALVPTVTDNLSAQHTIQKNLVGISFQPSNDVRISQVGNKGVTNGELTFGGADPAKYVGDVTTVPITSTYPSSTYWGIDQSITYGTSGIPILKKTAGIVDTGTTLVLIASDALAVYKNQTGAVYDPDTGLLSVTNAQYGSVKSLFFHIGSSTFEFTRNAQTWPRKLNTYIGGKSNKIYLIVGDLGSNSGGGFDFINGMAFHERFYVVYDSGTGSTNGGKGKRGVGVAGTK